MGIPHPPSTLLYPLWAPGGWPGSKASWGSHTRGKKEGAHSTYGIFLEPGSDSFLLTPVPSVFCPVGYWAERIPASLTLGSCPVPTHTLKIVSLLNSAETRPKQNLSQLKRSTCFPQGPCFPISKKLGRWRK